MERFCCTPRRLPVCEGEELGGGLVLDGSQVWAVREKGGLLGALALPTVSGVGEQLPAEGT